MTDLKDKISVSNLYEYYGELLTEKQQSIFEDYYFEDLSIIEIAKMNDVSKNAVYNSLKKSIKQLEKYEQILKIEARYYHNIDVLKQADVTEEIINKIK